MRERIISLFCILSCIVFCLFLGNIQVKAAHYGTPLVWDCADLLTEEEEQRLIEHMEAILPYGEVAFYTNPDWNDCGNSASAYAELMAKELFDDEAGILMLIDMYNRRIEFYSTGKMAQYINTARANQIADDIYTYATGEDYYTCATKGFEEVLYVLEGGKLTYTFRYATNAFLAIGLALMINFCFAWVSRIKRTAGQIVEATDDSENGKYGKYLQIDRVKMLKRTKSVHSSSSSSGGSGGGGGGGGAGGGHSF